LLAFLLSLPDAPTESAIEVTVASQGSKPCAFEAECGGGRVCLTNFGACNTAPGCKPGDLCATLCYGVCVAGTPCGDNVCGSGEFCCNESCGICVPEDGVCTQEFCGTSAE
jgi:hypothetical protein